MHNTHIQWAHIHIHAHIQCAHIHNTHPQHTHTHTHTHTHSADDIVLKIHGTKLTLDFLEQHGFSQPMIVKQKEGLGLRVPPPEFRISDVERYVGEGVCVCVCGRGYIYVCGGRCVCVCVCVWVRNKETK